MNEDELIPPIDTLDTPVIAPAKPASPFPWLAPEEGESSESMEAFLAEKRRRKANPVDKEDLVGAFANTRTPADLTAIQKNVRTIPGIDKKYLQGVAERIPTSGPELFNQQRSDQIAATVAEEQIYQRQQRVEKARDVQSYLKTREKLPPTYAGLEIDDQVSEDDLADFESFTDDLKYRERYDEFRLDYHESTGAPAPIEYDDFKKAALDLEAREALAKTGWFGESVAAWLSVGPDWQRTMNKVVGRGLLAVSEGLTGGLPSSLAPETTEALREATKTGEVSDVAIDAVGTVVGAVAGAKGVTKLFGPVVDLSLGAGMTISQAPGSVSRVVQGQTELPDEALSLGLNYGAVQSVGPIIGKSMEIGARVAGSKQLVQSMISNGVNLTAQTAVGAGQQLVDAFIQDRDLTLREGIVGALTNVAFSIGDVNAAAKSGNTDAQIMVAMQSDLKRAVRGSAKELARAEVELKRLKSEDYLGSRAEAITNQEKVVADIANEHARLADAHEDVRKRFSEAKIAWQREKEEAGFTTEALGRRARKRDAVDFVRKTGIGDFGLRAVGSHETAGLKNRAAAANARTNASGAFQMLESNVRHWSEQVYGVEMSAEDYRKASPEIQYKIAMGMYEDILAKKVLEYPEDSQKALEESWAEWYAGPRARWADRDKTYTHTYPDGRVVTEPSINQYLRRVRSKYDRLRDNNIDAGFDDGQPSRPPSEDPLTSPIQDETQIEIATDLPPEPTVGEHGLPLKPEAQPGIDQRPRANFGDTIMMQNGRTSRVTDVLGTGDLRLESGEFVSPGAFDEAQMRVVASNTAGDKVIEGAREIPVEEGQPDEPVLYREAPMTIGKETRVRSNSEEYPADYVLMDVRDVISSHDPFTFSPDDRYPASRQTRNYEEPQERQKVLVNAQKYDPAYTLSNDPTPVNGPPMVDLGLRAAGGNSRIMTLRNVYESFPEAAGEYKRQLREEATRYGLRSEDVDQFEQPVLVRRMNVDIESSDGPRIIDNLNQVPTYALDADAQGIAASRRLSNEQMSAIAAEMRDVSTVREALSTKGSTDEIRKILFNSGVIEPSNARKYLTNDGQFTSDGVRLVESLVMGRLIQDPALLPKIGETIKAKLAKAIPAIAQTEAVPGWSIRPKVENVLKYIAARGEMSDVDFKAQEALFGEDAVRLSDEEDMLRQVLEQRGHKAFKNLMEAYAERAGADLFGEASPDEILRDFGGKSLSGEADILYSRRERDRSAGRMWDGGRFPDLKNKRDIINFVARKFDVPIRYKYTPKGAGGYYKVSAKLIRLATRGDMGAVFHELGHHINHTLKLDGRKEFLDEIWRLGDPGRPGSRSSAKPSSPAGYRNDEGIAEFMRYLVMDEAEAIRLAPKLHEAFDSILGETPDWRDAIKWASNQWKRYQDAGPEARIHATTSWTAETTPILQGIRNSAESFIYGTFNQYYYILKARDYANKLLAKRGYEPLFGTVDPYVQARLMAGVDDIAKTALERGVPDFNSGAIKEGSRGLFDILRPLSNRMESWGDWMKAKREIEYHSRGFDIPDSIEDAIALRDKYKDDPLFNEIETGYRRWNGEILDYMVDSGAMSPAERKLMEQLNLDYFPMSRLVETGANEPKQEGGGSGSGGEVYKPGPLRRVRGSEAIVLNPIEQLVKNTQSLFYYSHKKQFMESLANLTEVEGMGRWIEELPNYRKVDAIELQSIQEQLKQLGIEVPDDVDLSSMLFRMRKANNVGLEADNIIALPNGPSEFKYYQIHPDLGKSLMSMGRSHSPNIIGKMFAPFAQLLRSGVTLVPEFSGGNTFRDSFAAAVLAPNFIPIITTLRGLAHVLDYKWTTGFPGGNADIVDRFFASGAGASIENSFYDRKARLAAIRERLKSSSRPPMIITNPLMFMRGVAEISEMSTKVGYFAAQEAKYIKEGHPVKEARVQAGYDARDLMDFALSGFHMHVLRQIAPFYGAGLTGMYKMWRSLRENPVRFTAAGMLSLALPSAALWYANHNDPDYWELDQDVRDNFWAIRKLNDGTWILLPKPYEIGTIFATTTEHFLSWLYTNDITHVESAMKKIFGISPTKDGEWALNMSPLGPFSGTLGRPLFPSGIALMPIAEAVSNYDFYRDKEIVPEGMDYLPKELQYSAATSLMARGIGQAFNVSPMKVDHLVSRMAGSLASRYAFPLVDLGISAISGQETPVSPKLPVIGRFVMRRGDSGYRHSIQLFYNEINRLEDEEKRKTNGLDHAFDRRSQRQLMRMRASREKVQNLRKKLNKSKDPTERKSLDAQMKKEVGKYIKNPADIDAGWQFFDKFAP